MTTTLSDELNSILDSMTVSITTPEELEAYDRAKPSLQALILRERLDEARKAVNMEALTGTDTGFTEGMQERIAELTQQIEQEKI